MSVKIKVTKGFKRQAKPLATYDKSDTENIEQYEIEALLSEIEFDDD